MVTDDAIARVAAEFGLGRLSGWLSLGGSSSVNLRIDHAGAPVVARFYRSSRDTTRIGAMQAARRALRDAGLPCPPVVSTPAGATLIEVDGALVEVEPFVEWDARMNSAPLLERGFELMARMHDVLRAAALPAAAHTGADANHIEASAALAATRRGAERIGGWPADPAFAALAAGSVELIEAVAAAEASLLPQLPRQLVHGDFWDNNVLFRGDEVVALIDFDFMGEWARIDELALTAYFWLLEPGKGVPTPADIGPVRRFLDAYDAAAELPLSAAERLALPLAMARQPAWSIGGWVLRLDEPAAMAHARSVVAELPVAQAILTDLDRWQDGLS